MSERKTLLVYDGANEIPMSQGEYRDFVAALPVSARGNIQILKGKVDTVSTAKDGTLTRGTDLDHHQIANRMYLGEDPVITGANDPKLDAKRRQDQQAIREEMADDENALAALLAVDPGFSTAFHNQMANPEELQQARAEIVGGNMGVYMASTVASLAAGGAGLTRGLAKVPTIGKAFQSGGTLKMLGQFAGADAATSAYLYAKHQYMYNQPFVAEDLAKEIGVGLAIGLPLMGGIPLYAKVARGIGERVAQGAGDASLFRAAAAGAGLAGDVAITGAVLKLGPVAKLARFGAGHKLISKVMRGRRKVSTAQHAQQGAEAVQEVIGRATVKGLKSTKNRDKILNIAASQTVVEHLTKLKNVTFETIESRINGMRAATRGARNDALSTTTKLSDPGIAQVTFSLEEEARFAAKAKVLEERLVAAGWGDYTAELGTIKYTDNVMEAYGTLARMRYMAHLKRTPGAAEASKLIKEMLEDSDVFGKVATRGKKINEGMDQIQSGYDMLDELTAGRNLDDVKDFDVASLEATDEAFRNVRQGYKKLRESGMLTESQAASLEVKFTKYEQAIAEGKKAMRETADINNFRRDAAATHYEKNKDYLMKVEGAELEDVQSTVAENVGETSGKILGFLKAAEEYMNEPGRVAARGSISAVLGDFTKEEKLEIYRDVRENIATLVGNPDALQEALAQQVSTLQASDPSLAATASVASVRGLYHLSNHMPKGDGSFYGRGRDPGRAQVNSFMEALIAMADPTTVGYSALEGRVSQTAIDVVRNVHPAHYAEMCLGISQLISENPPEKIPRKMRHGIGKFVGGLDPMYRPANIAHLQSKYAQTQAQQQLVGGNPQPMKQSTNENNFTQTQRLTSY